MASSRRRAVWTAIMSTWFMVLLSAPMGAQATPLGSSSVHPEVAANAAAPLGTIVSTGPLTKITTSPTLNCAVSYLGDTSPEFYGETACGTLVVVDDTLYGPGSIPAGGSATPRTPFTPVSQVGPTGSGVGVDPFQIETKVRLGTTGITLTQVDRYRTGEESYSTQVLVENEGATDKRVIVYRAGDCYLANSDYGYGLILPAVPGAPAGANAACKATAAGSGEAANGDRIQQFSGFDVRGGSGMAYMEGLYSSVWAAIGRRTMLPNTCECEARHDNAAAISWQIDVPSNGVALAQSQLAFANQVRLPDEDGDGLLDSWETDGYDYDRDGVVDVDLPAMGANPRHKDVFLELDWMKKEPGWCWVVVPCGGESFEPRSDSLEAIRKAFEGAPVTNPDGRPGIRLHIDAGPDSPIYEGSSTKFGAMARGSSIPYREELGSRTRDSEGWEVYSWREFYELRQLDEARSDVFHYGMLIDSVPVDSFGERFGGIASGLPGDSLMVIDANTASIRSESGSIMHELGHLLGLHHGGAAPAQESSYKPNYESVMNYLWQNGGDLVPGDGEIDYSRSVLPTLDEEHLNEVVGQSARNGEVRFYCIQDGRPKMQKVAAGSINWDCVGGADATDISANVDQGRVPPDPLPASLGDKAHCESDFENVTLAMERWASDLVTYPRCLLGGAEDWSKLKLDGGAVGGFGSADPGDQLPPPMETIVNEASIEELRAANLLANQGDGGLSFQTGGLPILHGRPNQKFAVRVLNDAAESASFELTVVGATAGLVQERRTVTVPGFGETVALFDVDGGRSVLGTQSVTATLRSVPASVVVDEQSTEVEVIDPATLGSPGDLASNIRQHPEPGVDPAVAGGLAAALDATEATPTTTSAPSVTTTSAPATTVPSTTTEAAAPTQVEGVSQGQPSGTALGVTGSSIGQVALLAVVCSLLGLALLATRRRRARRS